MHRTIYILYYLLYTITGSTIQYSRYIMYCVSSCNTIILIYYIKRTDVRYTINIKAIYYSHYIMYYVSCCNKNILLYYNKGVDEDILYNT